MDMFDTVSLEQQIAHLQSTLKNERIEHNATIALLETEVANSQTTIRNQQYEIQRSNDELQTLQQTNDNSTAQLNHLNKDYDELYLTLTIYKTKYEQLTATASEKLNAAKDEYLTVVGQIEQLTSENQQLNQLNSELQQQLNDSRGRVHECETIINEFDQRCTKAESDAEKLRNELSTTRSLSGQYQSQINQLEQLLEKESQTVEFYKKQLVDERVKTRVLMDEKSNLHAHVTKLEQQINDLQHDSHSVYSTSSDGSSIINELRAALQKEQTEKNEWQQMSNQLFAQLEAKNSQTT